VDIPCLSEFTVRQGLKERQAPKWNLDQLAKLSTEEKGQAVILVQDAFTSFYESEIVLQVYDLLQLLGVQVYVMPFFQNGKAYHVKGFLKEFGEVVAANVKRLDAAAEVQIPMIGIDPAVVLTYRDEYPHTLGANNIHFKVHLLQEWLSAYLLENREISKAVQPGPNAQEEYRLFGHCTEKTAAPASQQQWQQVYQAFGLTLNAEKIGCCGMCGVFGHEAIHEADSRSIYTMSWEKKVHQDQKILVTGYSCRSQVKRIEQFKPQHPIAGLLEVLKPV